jgi:hypothetical protein
LRCFSSQTRLDCDLAESKLLEAARAYHEIPDEASRKGNSMPEMVAVLLSMDSTAAQQRRLAPTRLRMRNTVLEDGFYVTMRITNAAIVRLFDRLD